MRRAYFLLAISLIAILFSNSLFARTSTIMSVATTEREIPSTTTFEPIKSINISNDQILSLAQEFGVVRPRKNGIIHSGDSIYPMDNFANFSYFMLTEEGNSNVANICFPGVTITDFDYDEEDKMIYFCGIHQVTNNYYQNVIGYFYKDLLFSGNVNVNINLYPINIPNGSSSCFLKKIDFYRVFDSGKKKLSLIANDNANTFAFSGSSEMILPKSYFITYDLQINDYHVEGIEKVRLTDVVHTNTKVAVVGIMDREHLVLFSHEQNNIPIYDGKVFETYTLYDFSEDMKYSIEALDNDTIIIGASVIADGYGRMEFTTFDISTGITIMNTQSIMNNNDIECRSKIVDMKYDRNNEKLHTISFSGYILKDMIFELDPYSSLTHASHIVIPNMMSYGKNLLKSLTLYKGTDYCYLAFGALDNQIIATNTTIGNLYFFDRFAYNSFDEESHCASVIKIDINTVLSKYILIDDIFYGQSHDLQSLSNQYTIQIMNPYTIMMMCND